MTDAPRARDTESSPPSVDYSALTPSEASVMIRLDDIGKQLKSIGETLRGDYEWKVRVTDLLVDLSKSHEKILRLRGEDDDAEALRRKRITLLPPYTHEDEETTQPGAE